MLLPWTYEIDKIRLVYLKEVWARTVFDLGSVPSDNFFPLSISYLFYILRLFELFLILLSLSLVVGSNRSCCCLKDLRLHERGLLYLVIWKVLIFNKRLWLRKKLFSKLCSAFAACFLGDLLTCAPFITWLWVDHDSSSFDLFKLVLLCFSQLSLIRISTWKRWLAVHQEYLLYEIFLWAEYVLLWHSNILRRSMQVCFRICNKRDLIRPYTSCTVSIHLLRVFILNRACPSLSCSSWTCMWCLCYASERALYTFQDMADLVSELILWLLIVYSELYWLEFLLLLLILVRLKLLIGFIWIIITKIPLASCGFYITCKILFGTFHSPFFK